MYRIIDYSDSEIVLHQYFDLLLSAIGAFAVLHTLVFHQIQKRPDGTIASICGTRQGTFAVVESFTVRGRLNAERWDIYFR